MSLSQIEGFTPQEKVWQSQFGVDYNQRCNKTVWFMENWHRQNYGQARSEINARFIGEMDRNIKILEVGCNSGLQIGCLAEMGFKNIFGIDIQKKALGLCRQRNDDFRLACASAGLLPFGNNIFDLVFTSGVLIHMSPDFIDRVMSEVYRCARQYIWGFEYYNTEYISIDYRGHDDLLWKGDFSQMYLDRFPDLQLIDQQLYRPTSAPDQENMMFILAKAR